MSAAWQKLLPGGGPGAGVRVAPRGLCTGRLSWATPHPAARLLRTFTNHRSSGRPSLGTPLTTPLPHTPPIPASVLGELFGRHPEFLVQRLPPAATATRDSFLLRPAQPRPRLTRQTSQRGRRDPNQSPKRRRRRTRSNRSTRTNTLENYKPARPPRDARAEETWLGPTRGRGCSPPKSTRHG